MNSHYTTVYKDSNDWYIAEGPDGEVISQSDTEPETVIQAAFDRKADVKIRGPADYILSETFDGLYFKSDTIIYGDFGATLLAPNGYTGGILIADPTVNGDTVKSVSMNGGLTLFEQGTPDQLWTGILMNLSHTTNGIAYCDFGNCFIRNANNAYAIDIQNSTGWITTCNFSKTRVYYTVNGIVNMINTAATSTPGISTLNFNDVWMQAAPQSEYGVKNSMGNNIWYRNCAVWDAHLSTVSGGMHSAQFSTLATNNFVLGGIMMHHQVEDFSAKGQVRWIDAHGPVPQWEFYKFFYETNGSEVGATSYQIPHNMGLGPDYVYVTPLTADAASSPFRVSHDNTYVLITYLGTPPPPATSGNQNNLKYEIWCSVR